MEQPDLFGFESEDDEYSGRGRPRGTYEKEPIEFELDSELYEHLLKVSTMTNMAMRASFARDFTIMHGAITGVIDRTQKTKRLSTDLLGKLKGVVHEKIHLAKLLGVVGSKPVQESFLD